MPNSVEHRSNRMIDVLKEVAAERERQEAKWGEQNHTPFAYLAILGEEVGEANKAALETFFEYERADTVYAEYRKELVQVAAVAVAAIECLDRDLWKHKCPKILAIANKELLKDAERTAGRNL